MISKIVMSNVASYKELTSLETDKRINLLYGLNGSGKSTLSNYLYYLNDKKFAGCSIEGLDTFDKILVYNQAFVRENFYESDNIKGIFTLSEENKIANETIEKAKNEIRNIDEKISSVEKEKDNCLTNYEKEKNECYEKTWWIKRTHAITELDYCLAGIKNSKEQLFKYVLQVDSEHAQPDDSVESLLQELSDIKNGGEVAQLISYIDLEFSEIEKSELLKKEIVGNKNSTVSDVIEKLSNSDWVEKGRVYINNIMDPEMCPFCQQRTITKKFLEEINSYFDESYQHDKEELSILLMMYSEKLNLLDSILKRLSENEFIKKNDIQLELVNTYHAHLNEILDKNRMMLRDKVDNPSIVITLNSVEEYIKKINELIEKVNREISVYNQRIRDINASKNNIKARFWKIMKNAYIDVIRKYEYINSKKDKDMKLFEDKLESYSIQKVKQEKIIKKNLKSVKNIEEAINNIKSTLLDIGITDIIIEKCEDDTALYRLRRKDDESEDIFVSLSEGEKMVLSFLYFLELCKGETEVNSLFRKKLIVIDDPISSLSHVHIFNIGRLIHNEFLRTTKYEQIFIFTHSLYFFYELSNINHEEREKEQKLFRLIKNESGSKFYEMKYEEIQNDYQAYWSIVKDPKQPAALIANCMRNIIEYFFNFVEKQDYNNIFQKKELQSQKFMAFNRYMNRESHSKGQNIFDLKEFDYETFKEALRCVFYYSGYEKHYKKMIK